MRPYAIGPLLVLAGCAGDVDFEVRRSRLAEPGAIADGSAARARDGASVAGPAGELALLTWNLEWFQDPERGPTDDARQMQAARDVLAQAQPDLAALQEIAVPERLADLIAGSPYAAVVSHYAWPQQTALLYRAERFALIATTEVSGLDDAGRPPLQVELESADGSALTVIVLHAKAGADPASWQRRERFAAGLMRYLAALERSAQRIVLGDFNDGFTRSIVEGLHSPYAQAVAGSGFDVPTAALEGGPEPSTVWGDTVDHVMLSDELAARVEPGSIDVLRDELLARFPLFFEIVSDHAPVVLTLNAR